MTIASFGLHKRGFLAPTYEEILDTVMDDFRRRFGDDISLESNSNFGGIARSIAWDLTELIQEEQRNYYSPFISTSTNSGLDRIGANLDLQRKVAMPSFANVVITTDDEYLIQAGEQFETEEGVVFDLIKDVITTKDRKTGKYTGIGALQSVETGEFNNVPANTITVVSNPDENIISVTNPEAAAGGQDDEDDATYRARLILENVAKPGPSRAGVESALMNLTGVKQAKVIDNPNADADEYGNPPYSVHVYVRGGTINDIAQCLADRAPIGITLVGSKSATVKDATGNDRVEYFDYAPEKQIFANVKIRTTDEWNVDQGAENIKVAIADYINDLKMGDTVYLTRIYPAIYKVAGVGEATVQIGTAIDKMDSKDITTLPFEVAVCDTENIEVSVDGA